jgi:CHAD domain-containing protein
MNRWERRIKRKLKSIANQYALLSRDPTQQHESIHRARRLTKQLRALIALLPPSFQHSIRKIVRDQKHIVQQLGLLRDENLFRQNIQELGAGLDTAHAFDTEPQYSAELQLEVLDLHKPLNQLAANVARIQQRLQDDDCCIHRKDLARQWKRSCKAFIKRCEQLQHSPPLAHWHELRKNSKLLEYQLRFLRKYSHHAAGPMPELVSALGKHLGQLNDFAKAQEALSLRRSPMGHAIRLDDEAASELLLEIEKGCDQEKAASLDLVEKILPLVMQIAQWKARELIE